MAKKQLVAAMILLSLIANQTLAQFDEFSDEPPASDSAPSGGGTVIRGNPNANKTLDKSQKDKFAKSGIEDVTNENFPEVIESFDFPNAEVADIVKAISELTGKNFIIDNNVRGKITIIAPSKITVAEAYKAFLSALAMNNLAVVPSGKFLKIRTARNAQRDSIETYAGSYFPNSDQMITRIIHLKHISAEAVTRDLRLLVSNNGEISPYGPTNSIILSDFGSNVERVMKIITQLDVPGFDDQLEVIQVKFAKAKDIAELVDKIVNKGQTQQNRPGGGFSSGVPRFTRSGGNTNQQGSAYFLVFPDDRTNSLIITGNKAGIERVRKLIGQLDFRLKPEEAGGVNVYYVKHGDAEKIAQVISGIAKEAAPKAAGGAPAAPSISPISGVQVAQQEIFGGDVKVTADKNTNSLVVVASKQDYEIVLNLLSKIDIPRDQVYVETVIMEMKLNDALNWEIGYFQYNGSGYGKVGFNGFSKTSLVDLLSPQGGNGTILGFASGDEVQVKTPTTSGTTATTTLKSLVGFINFLKTNSNVNILSTPQIMALDNEEAQIEVGDKVVTGSTQSAATATSASVITPTFEEATIKLKIKPFISKSTGSVRMEIDSSVKQLSSARTPDAFKSSTQPLATRSIKTNIVVSDGNTAVLGGLMKEDELEDVAKVPLLGDIPILGWLFKSKSSSREKTNLLVFLTPRIVRDENDNKSLMGKKMDQRLDFIKQRGGRDPYGKVVDELRGTKTQLKKDKEESITE